MNPTTTMMLKATITNLIPRIRCVRFSHETSPSSINDGKGWRVADQVEFLQEMGVRQLQESASSVCTIRRIQEPTRQKQASRELCRGVTLWLDK